MGKKAKIIVSSIVGVSLVTLSIIISHTVMTSARQNEILTTNNDNNVANVDNQNNPTPQPSTPTPSTPTPSTSSDDKPTPSVNPDPVTPKPDEPIDPGEEKEESDGGIDDTLDKYKAGGVYTADKFYSMDELLENKYINYYANGTLSCSPSKLNELTSFVFKVPEGIKLIDKNSLKNCTKITKVIFPSSLTTIYSSAFFGCKNLVEADLSKNITRIDNDAFSYCESLKSINVPKNYVDVNLEAFRFLNSVESIVVE